MRTLFLLLPLAIACGGDKSDDTTTDTTAPSDADTDTDADSDTDTDTDADSDSDTDTDSDSDTDTDTDTGTLRDTAWMSGPSHAGCETVLSHPNVVRDEWMPQAAITGYGPALLVQDDGTVHVARSSNIGTFQGHHFVDDGTGFVDGSFPAAAAHVGLVQTSVGTRAVSYGGAPNSTSSLSWTPTSGWSAPTSAPGADLVGSAHAVGVADDTMVSIGGDGSLTLATYGSPLQLTPADDGSGAVLAVRPDDTVDVFSWATSGGHWVLRHWTDGSADDIWDSGTGGRPASPLVAAAHGDELFVMHLWDRDLFAMRRDSTGSWSSHLQLTSMTANTCDELPQQKGQTCDYELHIANPIDWVLTDTGAAIVYGVMRYTARYTAVNGFPGGLYWASGPLRVSGDVRLATFDASSGLVDAEIVLDGVASGGGQAQLDALGQAHLALQDHHCDGSSGWVTRYTVVDAALLP